MSSHCALFACPEERMLLLLPARLSAGEESGRRGGERRERGEESAPVRSSRLALLPLHSPFCFPLLSSPHPIPTPTPPLNPDSPEPKPETAMPVQRAWRGERSAATATGCCVRATCREFHSSCD